MLLVMLGIAVTAVAQDTYNQIDESGNVTQRRENGNFNPFNNDTTKNKEIPRGLHVWTVDRRFGDIIPAAIDTMTHLYHKKTLNTGVYGDYNTTGSNYTPRMSRIFIDRPEPTHSTFTDVYSYVYKNPDSLHFTNTLSPITNLSYDNCGDKTNGEDHIEAKFAVNAGRRLGIGFDLNYAYARGYFSNQSTAHFGSTFYASYLGDRYQMHAIASLYHQKATENGGITEDKYITHPEASEEDYSENEIPTILNSHWNRNDNQHLFLTHRYSVGFYRKVPMTEEELRARKFASQSKKEKEEKAKRGKKDGKDADEAPAGRPDGAKIAGPAPKKKEAPIDSTRIKVENKEQLDSLLALERQKEEEDNDSTMKREYVPVTSFIHTLELNNYNRIYQAYKTPTNYFLQKYYDGPDYLNDSIFDKTRHTQVKNTVAIALLEGFNKYVKSGLKIFATHDLRQYTLPDSLAVYDTLEVKSLHSVMQRHSEHGISIGAQLTKTQGSLLHYNLMAETWLIGEESGQLKLDANLDINIPFLGDTLQIAGHGYFHRLHPTFYQRHYHSKHFWWDNDGLEKEMRTHIEGRLSFPKTKTQLRVAVEEIQNYTYLGMNYDLDTSTRTNMTASIQQKSGNINVFTAQLRQNFRLGILNWENIITYQSSSDKDVLPLPTLNAWTNLFLKFKIARVLSVELGADGTYFTKYYAPDFCPALNQFAIQQNEVSRIEVGEFPFVNAYANLHLKRARFFFMMTDVLSDVGNRSRFLTAHYPVNSRTLHMGVSWNFFN